MPRRSVRLAALALGTGLLTAAMTTTCAGVYADERAGVRLGASADFSFELADATSVSSCAPGSRSRYCSATRRGCG